MFGMEKTAEDPQRFVSGISLTGSSRGLVKSLAGFRKQHHTVPDAVNAATAAFLGKLCAAELREEAEGMFQRAKTALNYKRKDLTLEVAGGTATLTTKDFVYEIAYSLDPADPADYVAARALRHLRNGALVDLPEFDGLFAGMFTGILFTLTNGVRGEAVIDAVEALADESPLTVDYPSDCRTCRLRVDGVGAEVVCDGGSLEMVFPGSGSPRELVAAFAGVRAAFVLTQDPVLSGLI